MLRNAVIASGVFLSFTMIFPRPCVVSAAAYQGPSVVANVSVRGVIELRQVGSQFIAVSNERAGVGITNAAGAGVVVSLQ